MKHWRSADGSNKCGVPGDGVEVETAYDSRMLQVSCPECASALIGELREAGE